MGICSYVLTGTELGITETFGTTCLGAGRALYQAKSWRNLDFQDVLDKLVDMGIAVRVASPKLVLKEAPESYKNVMDVVNTCHDAGIGKKAINWDPLLLSKSRTLTVAMDSNEPYWSGSGLECSSDIRTQKPDRFQSV